MKKRLYIPVLMVLTSFQQALAAQGDLENALKDSTKDPSLSTIIFALLFVIFLIYVTGIIYSKLNIVGTKAAKEQFRTFDINRANIISTTQLGQNKNLHVIELNDKYYLIGATLNSINLIKDLGEIKNEKNSFEYEKPADIDIDKAIRVLYGKNDESIIAQQKSVENFDIHKKYL